MIKSNMKLIYITLLAFKVNKYMITLFKNIDIINLKIIIYFDTFMILMGESITKSFNIESSIELTRQVTESKKRIQDYITTYIII